MEKKEKKKLLLAATLSILSLSNCANAQDVNSWADLDNILKSGQNATLSQSITARVCKFFPIERYYSKFC